VRDVSCEGLLVEDIRITLVKDIEELTSSDLVAWRHFLQEINDPSSFSNSRTVLSIGCK